LKPLGLKIAVITNSSLIWREDVRDDLLKADWVSLYALMEPHQVFDGVSTPPVFPDLPKEITLAEEPAKDCTADRIIIKSWLPRFLLKSGF